MLERFDRLIHFRAGVFYYLVFHRSTPLRSGVNPSPYLLPHNRTSNITLFAQIENQYGQIVIHAHRNRGRIHYLKVFLQNFAEGQMIETSSRGIAYRVAVIHAIHRMAPLEDYLCADFQRAQAGGAVGGEVWISGS